MFKDSEILKSIYFIRIMAEPNLLCTRNVNVVRIEHLGSFSFISLEVVVVNDFLKFNLQFIFIS